MTASQRAARAALLAALALLALMALPVSAQEGRELLAAPVKQAPTIDGDLSDASWAVAPAMSAFTLVGGKQPAPKLTTVRALFDLDRLYLAVECAEPDMAHLKAQPRPRDGGAWNDDCVEIFLRPGSDETQYVQLVINAAGSADDYGHITPAAKPVDWNPTWEAKAKALAQGWQIELSIGFAELGATAPKRGDVWGLKPGREDYTAAARTGEKTARLYTWPAGTSYGGATGYGLLVFEDRNVVVNPDFTTLDGRKFAGWYLAPGDEGCFETTTVDGQPALLLHAPADRHTSITQTLSLQAGGSYHLSFEAKSEMEAYLEIRQYLTTGNTSPPYAVHIRKSEPFVSYELDFPAGPVGRADIRFQGLKQPGQAWLRKLRVEQTPRNVLPDYMTWAKTQPDPVHGLTAFMERQGIKPYERLHDLSLDDCERLVFRDTVTGTELWKMTNDTVPEGHQYALWPPYSANGAHLWFDSRRWIPSGQQAMQFVMAANGDNVRLMIPWYNLSGWWHPRDGDVYFYIFQRPDHYELTALNVRTGEKTILATLPPKNGVQLAEPGTQSEFLLVVNPDGLTGLSVKMDGSVKHELSFPQALGETHFSRAHKDVFISFYHASRYANAPGEIVLRLTPDGLLDPDFTIKDKSTTKYRNFSRGGHGQSSPDETMFAHANGTINLPDGTQKQIVLPEAIGSGDYVSWRASNEWFLLETFTQTVKYWADGSNAQQLCFANSQTSTYYSLPWSAGSPDGTKFAYRSTMTNNVELYQAIVSKPLPPVNVTAKPTAKGITLAWQPPVFHKEIAGYLVYRSAESGRGYAQLSPQLVEATTFTDSTAAKGKGTYYVVTAVEYSGLESACSAEVCATATWPGPVRHFYEAEFATLKQPVVQRRAAIGPSNMHYVSVSDYLGEKLQQPGSATFALSVPRAGTYRLLSRARVAPGNKEAKARFMLDGKPAGEWSVKATDWGWLPAMAPMKLTAGAHQLAWIPDGAAFELDALCLTDDPKFTPTGLGLADQTPPPLVTGLTARETTTFDAVLAWDPDRSLDLSHYNIYASRQAGFTPSQATRVGSVYKPGLLDWGLKPDTTYCYRVTAADRAGNEGPPSAEVTARAQPLQIGQIIIEAETGQPTGQAVVHELPEASGGKGVWVPEIGTTGEYPRLVPGKATGGLTASFTAPVDGKYMLWGKLRSLWTEARLECFIDGRRLGPGNWPISFGYYHEKAYMIWGPRATTSYIYCWCPARTNTCPEPRPFLADLKAGPHQLELRGLGEGLSVDQLVLTNDYSWIPSGPQNYY